MTVYFGPAGASESFYTQGNKSSLDMPDWLAKLGLNAYEYQSTRGVKIGEEMALKLGQLASQRGIRLSMHAPYYINLAARDEEMKIKTKGHLIRSLKAASLMGAKVVVFHPGSGSGGDRKGILAGAKNFLKDILDEAEAEGVGSCNNMERKFKSQDACSVANTILKMAKKRAFVDAVLSATRSSDLFTQDTEDDDERTAKTSKEAKSAGTVKNGDRTGEKKEAAGDPVPASRKQISYIFTILSQKNIPVEKARNLMEEKYLVRETKALSQT
jgi:hypothetical protein